MGTNVEILLQFIKEMFHDTNHARLDIEALDEEHKILGRALSEYNEYIKETYNYSLNMANGILDYKHTQKNNPYIGPLKD